MGHTDLPVLLNMYRTVRIRTVYSTVISSLILGKSTITRQKGGRGNKNAPPFKILDPT